MFKVFKKFYQFLFYYKKDFISFVLVLVVATVLNNLHPYIYKLLIDKIPSRDYRFLIELVVLLVVTRIVGNLLDTLSYYLGDRVLIPAAKDARVNIFNHIQNLDFAFHIGKSTGSLISIFKRGDGAFFNFFHAINQNISRTAISLLVVLFFFGQIIPSIAFLMLGIFLANAFVSWYLVKINVSKRKLFNEAEDRISGIITDNLINYETVKFFAQEKREEKRLEKEFGFWGDKLWGYAKSFRLMDITVGTLSSLGLLAIFWIAIHSLILGKITTGDLVMIVTFSFGFYFRFFDLLYQLREIAKHYTDMENYFSILDMEILVKDPEKPVRVKNIKGGIVFEEVSFSYPEGKQNALVGANLDIRPGESVAFVGRSGAGKTTVIKLLLRFYDVDEGRILIDGIDIRNFSKNQLRSFMGIVPQEPILFNNTIGFNIAYGNPKAKKETVVKAARMANLDEFIESLPKKYETPVGERGIRLSGGQKQRLAIARMILANPKIIVFDEATSQLDSESERLIQDAFWKIAKGKTVLIIAHRFSTVQRADRIIVIDEGQIVESGSHNELIKEQGLYYHLWQLQSQGKIQDDPDLLR